MRKELQEKIESLKEIQAPAILVQAVLLMAEEIERLENRVGYLMDVDKASALRRPRGRPGNNY